MEAFDPRIRSANQIRKSDPQKMNPQHPITGRNPVIGCNPRITSLNPLDPARGCFEGLKMFDKCSARSDGKIQKEIPKILKLCVKISDRGEDN